MYIVSIDTSGKSGGIALAEGDETSFRLLGSSPIAGGMFSAQLVPSLAALLAQHSLVSTDLGGFVAVSGPGSFTGLRVGLSAIKGLAVVLQKPIATVSLLEAVASLSAQSGLIVAALDAGRNEAFWGLYRVEEGHAKMVEERLLSQSEMGERAKASGAVCLVTSDHPLAEVAAHSGLQVQEIDRPGSEVAARLGLPKLLHGETVAIEALDANYLRRSDAEIFFKAKA